MYDMLDSQGITNLLAGLAVLTSSHHPHPEKSRNKTKTKEPLDED
jgi:hypothetical protein